MGNRKRSARNRVARAGGREPHRFISAGRSDRGKRSDGGIYRSILQGTISAPRERLRRLRPDPADGGYAGRSDGARGQDPQSEANRTHSECAENRKILASWRKRKIVFLRGP